ncbi:MAG: tetratricopeptide repeat protein [candidate division WS1 bacterium]|jgi:tetratricopeptide (TPR) repeat protein|nr:tetratricopeptide repeat protein [candidate division WS1 bacterium]
MIRVGAILLAVAALGLSGCDGVDQLRREFVALRYMQDAETDLQSLPRLSGRAERAVDRALALLPEDEQLQRRAARLYAIAGAWEKAIALFEADPELGPQDRSSYAMSLLGAGETEHGARLCLELIQSARKGREQNRIGLREWALLLNDAGYILADNELHLDTAYQAVVDATGAFPLEAAFIDSVGWALYRKGQPKDAAFHLERARRMSPREDPEMLYHLGVVYGRLGRYGDASEVLMLAHELAPDSEEILKELQRQRRIMPPLALVQAPAPQLQF